MHHVKNSKSKCLLCGEESIPANGVVTSECLGYLGRDVLTDFERAMFEKICRQEELLYRIRQWDHLDESADGPYWKSEIDKSLEEPI